MKTSILALLSMAIATAATPIVTFDGADPLTTWKFREVNDPVMGGQSVATFNIVDGVGIFDGTCAIVPKLKAPGFCSIQTTDNSSGATAKGIDARGSTHLLLEVKSDIAYTGFKVALSADNMTGVVPRYGANSYKADFSVDVVGEWTTVAVPFETFSSNWSPYTGEPITTCAEDDTVCIKEINKNHFSRVEILAEGVEGDFHIEIRDIRAENMEAPVLALADRGPDAVDIATFDGADPLTTWKWRELNDPVMGGKSTGSINIVDNVAVFTGTCAIVDKLNAPGFCVAETTNGFGIMSKGIDASGRSHLVMEVRSSKAYEGFKLSLAANTLNPQFASFKANLDIPVSEDFITIKVPFNEFSNKWSSATGEATVKCADDESVCISEKNKKSFSNIGIWAEGHEGDFKLEVKNIRAENVAEAASFLIEEDEVNVVTFDGTDPLTTWKFREVNDPVMGGQSTGDFEVVDGVAIFSGNCAIVPSLKAPGFCKLESTDGFGIKKKGIDASGKSHVALEVRSSVAYDGFKIAFTADTVSSFFSFKANVDIPVSEDFITVTVPFTDFSNKWSPATGEAKVKCADDASVCMTEKNKKDFSQVGFWAEGHEGDFKLEIKSVKAVNLSEEQDAAINMFLAAIDYESSTDPNKHCVVQTGLRYNMDAQDSIEQMFPVEGDAGETLGAAICCDDRFNIFAEPQFLYERPDIGFLAKVGTEENPTTYFDSACGIPVFKAPVGRSAEAFLADTEEHGWPSFRSAELIAENVMVLDDNRVVSKCGTMLGSFLPDEEGDRYCIDTVCVSGNPVA